MVDDGKVSIMHSLLLNHLDQDDDVFLSFQIRPVLDGVFPFASLPAAYDKVHAQHNRGKTVIDVKGEHAQQYTSEQGEEHNVHM